MTKTQKELVDYLQTQSVFKHNIYKYSWQVGSHSFAPVCVWEDRITCNMATRKQVFNKLIERVKQRFELEYAIFWKGDGSCPSQLIFKFK